MRSRPVGPGLGGLYYPPLLEDANRTGRNGARATRPARSATADRRQGFRQDVVAAFRRGFDRLVQARMAEAQRQIDEVTRKWDLDGAAAGRSAARYY